MLTAEKQRTMLTRRDDGKRWGGEQRGEGGGLGKLVLGSRSQKVATVVLVSNSTVGALQLQE